MSKRMNIATPRKAKDGKTFWTNIGTAWFNDNGQIQLVFDALPLTDNGTFIVTCVPLWMWESPSDVVPVHTGTVPGVPLPCTLDALVGGASGGFWLFP